MPPPAGARTCDEGHTVIAEIVALEQPFLLNRFGAYVPGGMLFALAADVVAVDTTAGIKAGNVRLRDGKRPRPLVLRVNQGDCIEIHFRNLLSREWREEGGQPSPMLPAHTSAPAGGPGPLGMVKAEPASLDLPRTRAASFHVIGLEIDSFKGQEAQCPPGAACGGAGMNVGLPDRQGVVFGKGASAAQFHGSLAMPDQLVVTRWRATREGAYFAYSAGATVGGEGDGGQIAQGLFGAVLVEPAGSRWYRSQVTHDDLVQAAGAPKSGRHPYATIDYETMAPGGGAPLLNMLDARRRIVHSDLNAIVVPPEKPKGAKDADGTFGSEAGRAFREFTVIFHDEVPARQAFAELADDDNPLSNLRDNMGINYGVSSMGALVAATPTLRAVGPVQKCFECRAEEFFLSSWANGDPALILAYESGKATPSGARYPDDPSNVHHAYLGDPVRFRNVHAGPKETHVFHLHAHQWVMDSEDPNSMYLDSQTISPGATFSYQIEFGGAGNRNYTVGDSIFHCHLYPHFAQGMWELWRVHDVFEDGKMGPRPYTTWEQAGPGNDPRWRNLPDGEIPAGTANPALVPLPGAALAPLPTASMPGYPFYIPGMAGHRPPQPALDMDVDDPTWTDASVPPQAGTIVNGGLPRHVVEGGSLKTGPEVVEAALKRGGMAAQVIAQRVSRQDAPERFAALAAEWKTLSIKELPHTGTDAERRAMTFHEGALDTDGLKHEREQLPADKAAWWPRRIGYRTDVAATVQGQGPRTRGDDALFFVNGLPRKPGAPYANPCPQGAPERDYRAAFIQTELVYNRHGWFDPQGRMIVLEDDIKDIVDADKRTRLPEPLFFRANSGECVVFKSTNLVPSALNADDFQIITPTDTIGQHIHLVKFDVTSSDGSGNGWNYEDGTFSPEEVRERILAYNRTIEPNGTPLTMQVHPLFQPGGTIEADKARHAALLEKGQCPGRHPGENDDTYRERLNRENPYCGAQRTVQRWWADPILSAPIGAGKLRRDNTLRTVFTHDHFGPSSHQQHGLYAALVIEPANSLWLRPDATLTPAEIALLPGKNKDAVLDLAAQQACLDPKPDTDAAVLARCKVLGGSNLAAPSAPSILRKTHPEHPLAWIEPREPLRLRPDGGPTSTMASIYAPGCVGDSDSNPLQPKTGHNRADGPRVDCVAADQTRREFALAFADFGIAYNAALEPINPEPRGDSMMRDASSIRFGRRHVMTTPARPLGISSEDPGSQYVNYRHEPLALRIADVTKDTELGGFEYRQSALRADLASPCLPGDSDCLGDMANALASKVHAARDKQLAISAQQAIVTQATRDALRGTPYESKVDDVVRQVEQWRQDFNCALYPLMPNVPIKCRDHIEHREPWRVFGDPATPILPTYEGEKVQLRLIQGAQEAQHIFTMNGVKWLHMPASKASGYTNAQPLGISEHFEFDVAVQALDAPAIDYLYFGSSVDQMWDGMWGFLRSYRHPAREVPPYEPAAFLTPLSAVGGKDAPLPPDPGGNTADICARPSETVAKSVPGRVFDVSAVRVCDLYGDCGASQQSGIAYSRRFGIVDQHALIYVLASEENCRFYGVQGRPNPMPTTGAAKDCDQSRAALLTRGNADVLETLRRQFAAGRPVEPLVLRAPAGACIDVTLRNHLPPRLDDGAPDGDLLERDAYNNFLPMITDGFNVNQYRMSSSIGLSAPRVAQNPIAADGSNVGRNAMGGRVQGSLVPPCAPGEERCGKSEFRWSATDYEHGNVPMEFGALPLRSFGDPIKHTMHGLGGALVIGPAGSSVCHDDRFARAMPGSRPAERLRIPGGVSAEICGADGRVRYVDHVLMVQDAVNATRGGMPVGNLSGAEEPDDYGMKALNYRTEPLWARRANDPSVAFDDRSAFDYADALTSARLPDGRCAAGISPGVGALVPCDPETPVMTARPGEAVRLNVVHPGGHTRQMGIAVAGHNWNPYPWSAKLNEESRVFDSGDPTKGIRQGVFNGFGPMMGVTLEIRAGGAAGVPMDYLIRSQASFLFDGGIWGLLRVDAAPGASAPPPPQPKR